ncbi:unnamed protein product [Rotaria sp. Silwood2]|nr:unnamed protein product [Rotaria sp. Silwood2]CAF2998387.1 unnamed protein product [Rotaria sp. Silwood2]CAF4207611.1 unnamed protein product [Rotaria sp. Silwood2]CAF4292854.1 unnamed protein product [Rotaria sp. Silwood2]
MTDTSIDELSPLVFQISRISPKADNRTSIQKKFSVWLILITVALERLAFFSLVGNLILFLTSNSIRWTSLHSIMASLIFYGTSYISALAFSWISDAKLGRAKTILIGFVVYIIGYLFIPLFSKVEIFETLCNGRPTQIDESMPYSKEKCSIPITTVLVVTAIGVGTVQSNMAILGAEQIQEQKSTTQYFYKYYISVTIGCLLAFGLIAYIQQNKSYFIGYLISIILLVVTLVVFLIGYRCYIHIKPYDSVLTNFFPVLINAFQTWRKHRCYVRKMFSEHRFSNESMFSNDQYDDNNKEEFSFNMNEQSISFFDYAKGNNNGRFPDRIVDDIKSLRRIIIMFLLLVPYWLIYLQSNTTFIVQGVHMKIPLLQSHINRMPIVWLSLCDQTVHREIILNLFTIDQKSLFILVVVIFILNTCLYKRLHINNRPFSIKIRMVIGMISATLSMCLTGIVEIFRQKKCDSSFQQTIGNTTYYAADMSILYQFPQYISIGLSEVFTSVASLEFAYLAAPQSAQSLVMSLRFCSVGLSSFLGSAYINIYENVYENFTVTNLECKDTGKPELFYIYFFVLAVIQFIFIFIFLGCDRKFQILKASQHRFDTHLFIGPSSQTSNI